MTGILTGTLYRAFYRVNNVIQTPALISAGDASQADYLLLQHVRKSDPAAVLTISALQEITHEMLDQI